MNGWFYGSDINGQVDRTARLQWPDRRCLEIRALQSPAVIEDLRASEPLLTGETALRHPAGRGWRRACWDPETARRHAVADALEALQQGDADAPGILRAHFAEMVGAAPHFAFAVPDDFASQAQSSLIQAAAVEGLGRGGIGPTCRPVWRSVAALLGWAQDAHEDDLRRLEGRRALVVSLLSNRFTVASLQLELAAAESGLLLAPFRLSAGRGYGDRYPPDLAESAVLDPISDPTDRDQLERMQAGHAYLRGEQPEILLEDRAGRWWRPPELKPLPTEFRQSVLQALRKLMAQATREHCALVLVEGPDDARGFPDLSWTSAALDIVTHLHPGAKATAIGPGTVAKGCAEYDARLAAGLPTFFDNVPQIEVATRDDRDRPIFVPLLYGHAHVAGHETVRGQVEGSFIVPAGAGEVTFLLYREDAKGVAKATIELPIRPEVAVPITLAAEQTPVGGHPVVRIEPALPGSLGAAPVRLDWSRVEPVDGTKVQVLEQLKRERALAFPNAAPTRTHWAVWRALDVAGAMERFLHAPAAAGSGYTQRVAELRSALAGKSNPAFSGDDLTINEDLHAFDSEGAYPTSFLLAHGKGADLVNSVKRKIDGDIAALGAAAADRGLRQQLCLAGSWMFAAAPEGVIATLRRAAKGDDCAPDLIEAMGRVFASPEDVRLGFSFFERRIRSQPTDERAIRGTVPELIAAASILQLRTDAGGLMTTTQAELITAAALGIIGSDLRSGNGTKPLQQMFLWAVLAILLVLRHRNENKSFLLPPIGRPPSGSRYGAVIETLTGALEAIERGRPSHRLARSAVQNAIAFIEKSGGNPNVVRVISRELDGAAARQEAKAERSMA